jgi:hypothetical protein
MCVFLNSSCCLPKWVVVFGWCLFDNVKVGVTIRGLTSDCGPEIADAVFPVEICLPIKDSLCARSVLLKRS